jgi:hypothetical protein
MRENFVRAMVPETEADLRLVEAQLDISRKQTAPTTYTLPFTAIVVAATNFYWVPTVRLLLWPLYFGLAR